MLYVPETSPVDGRVHRQNVAILSACSQVTTKAALVAALPAIIQSDDLYFFFVGGPLLPRRTYIYSSNSNFLLVVLNGMEGGDKVAACLSGWDANQAPNSTVNPYGSAGAQVVTEILGQNIFSSVYQVVVIGHSYGGAVAPYVGAGLAQEVTFDNVHVYSYGAPKTNSQTASGVSLRLHVRRVYRDDDPVPSLPPSDNDLNQLWTLIGLPTARRWSRWRHQGSGYSLSVGGFLDPAVRPYTPITWPGLWNSLTSLLQSGLMFGNNNHSLAAYTYAIGTTPNVTIPSDQPAPVPLAPPPPEPPVRVLEQRRDEAFIQQANIAAADPQAAAQALQVGIPLVPGVRYKGGYAQGHPAIYYDGQLVLVVKTRRQRRAIVRYMNRSLI